MGWESIGETPDISAKTLLLRLGIPEEKINNLWSDGLQKLVEKARKSIQRALSPHISRIPDHGGHSVLRTRQTSYMTWATFEENKSTITPLFQKILDGVPKQKNYRYHWDDLRRIWNDSDHAKVYGRLPRKNYDTMKSEFSISTIYGIEPKKDAIENYFGIKFAETLGQNNRNNERQLQIGIEDEEKKKQERDRIANLPWDQKMEEKWYIVSKHWFWSAISDLRPLFQKYLDAILPAQKHLSWRDALDQAFKEYNKTSQKKLILLNGNYYKKYGRDIWRTHYHIGNWGAVQKLFFGTQDIQPAVKPVDSVSIVPTITPVHDSDHHIWAHEIPTAVANPIDPKTRAPQIEGKGESRKLLIQSIKASLEEDLRSALEKYAKWKTLTWRISDFVGFPSITDWFSIQIENHTHTIKIWEIQDPIQSKIWNAISTQGYISEITKKRVGWGQWSYVERGRKYKITEGKKVIYLCLPPALQTSREVTKTTSKKVDVTLEDPIEKMNHAKSHFQWNIDAYLAWYYENKIEKKHLFRREEFIFGKIANLVRWEFKDNKLEGSLSRSYSPSEKDIMTALHKKDAWDEFLQTIESVIFSVDAISWKSENIRIHDSYQGIEIKFTPYYVAINN